MDNKVRKYRDIEDDSDTLYNIESEDEDNLYSLDDRYSEIEENVVEDKNNNFSEEEESYKFNSSNITDDNEPEDDVDLEDDEDLEDEEENINKGSLFLLLFKIMSTPVEGWKEFKRRRYTVEEVSNGCFYPLVALAAVSEFAEMIYTTASLSTCLLRAVTAFIAFFFGYFTIILLSGVFLPKVSVMKVKGVLGKEFVMMNLSTLTLFFTAINLFKMIDAVLVFLPIWTIYLIYKGVRILRVPNEVESRTKIVLTFLIIGAPLLWQWFVSLVI